MITTVICVLIMIASACGLAACVHGFHTQRKPVTPEPLPEPICPYAEPENSDGAEPGFREGWTH